MSKFSFSFLFRSVEFSLSVPSDLAVLAEFWYMYREGPKGPDIMATAVSDTQLLIQGEEAMDEEMVHHLLSVSPSHLAMRLSMNFRECRVSRDDARRVFSEPRQSCILSLMNHTGMRCAFFNGPDTVGGRGDERSLLHFAILGDL